MTTMKKLIFLILAVLILFSCSNENEKEKKPLPGEAGSSCNSHNDCNGDLLCSDRTCTSINNNRTCFRDSDCETSNYYSCINATRCWETQSACESYASCGRKKSLHEVCNKNADCVSGHLCLAGLCIGICNEIADCESGFGCFNGICTRIGGGG